MFYRQKVVPGQNEFYSRLSQNTPSPQIKTVLAMFMEAPFSYSTQESTSILSMFLLENEVCGVKRQKYK